MPLMLKPAPTRMRLILWSLASGLEEFPEAPPPGLVTIPKVEGAPDGFYSRAGYRLAGARAIRIDMLERLADQIRNENTRGGFEAKADMLSITGCTLEQFADLMQGLGYKAERGERPKAPPEAAKPEPAAETAVEPAETPVASVAEPAPVDEPPVETSDAEAPADAPPVEASVEEAPADAPPVEASVEEAPVSAGRDRRPRNADAVPGGKPERVGKPDGRGKPKGPRKGKGAGRGKPDGKDKDRPREFSARPPKQDKPIDPDNPFAALMALKQKR
jgi:ATP-dependent RNA helicase SUPV3L1/SUV3